jgi:hypothetical protein
LKVSKHLQDREAWEYKSVVGGEVQRQEEEEVVEVVNVLAPLTDHGRYHLVE